MAKLANDGVDVCVTSPPYNLRTRYNTYDDGQEREEYLAWTHRWVEQVQRVLAPDGSFFLNLGAAPAHPWLPHEVALSLKDLFILQNTFHWIKSISIQTKEKSLISAGHFKPLNSHRFVTDCHEYIFHLTKSGAVRLDRLAIGVPYADKSNIRRWTHTGGADKRCRGNNWFIPYDTIQNQATDRPHPATFPVRLPQMCLKLHGLRPGMVVLDPFLGLGTTGLAALECGASRFIGFEIDPGYFQVAREKLQNHDHRKVHVKAK